MIFALCDLTATIEVHHINAALAWIRYSVDSVKFIFSSASDEVQAQETNQAAQKIVDFLMFKDRVTRKQITTECFKGHTNKTQIDAALDELLKCNPPRIKVQEDRSGAGRPTKFYELAANNANYANNEQAHGLAVSAGACEQSELSDKGARDAQIVGIVRVASEVLKPPNTRASNDYSHTSPNSHADSKIVEDPEHIEFDL